MEYPVAEETKEASGVWGKMQFWGRNKESASSMVHCAGAGKNGRSRIKYSDPASEFLQSIFVSELV